MSMSFKMSYYKLLAEMCFMRVSDLMRHRLEPGSLHLKSFILWRISRQKNLGVEIFLT